MIDELIVFDRGLTKEEIDQLYCKTKNRAPSKDEIGYLYPAEVEENLEWIKIRDRTEVTLVDGENVHNISGLMPFRYARLVSKLTTTDTTPSVYWYELEAMPLVVVGAGYPMIRGEESWKASTGTESVNFVSRDNYVSAARLDNLVIDLEGNVPESRENVWRKYLEDVEEDLNEGGYNAELDNVLLRLTIEGIQPGKKDIYLINTIKDLVAWIF